MESLLAAAPWILLSLAAAVSLAALRKPLSGLLRLLCRTAIGLVVLFALSKVGGFIGITLGINLPNALVMGILGAPGFGLLLMLNWVLR